MIYYCEHCGQYITEDETYLRRVDLEDEYGVGGMFPDHHYETWMYCVNCGESSLKGIINVRNELEDLLDTLEDFEIPLDDYVAESKEFFSPVHEDDVVELFNHILNMIRERRYPKYGKY